MFSDQTDEQRIADQVRAAVGAESFDYAALAAGVHQRAGRIRRRRAVARGAAVAVLGPALVGGSALLLPDLMPGALEGTVSPPASSVSGPSASLAQDGPQEPALQSAPATAAAEQQEPSGSAVQDPPWQQGSPPLPAGGVDDAHSGNAWQIPDARPTGIGYLDAFGAPELGLVDAQTVPVSGVMICDAGQQQSTPPLRPVAGQSWMYFHEDSFEAGTVSLQVTGWEDSSQARDALSDGTMTYCVRDGQWQPLSWAGHEGDQDRLLYQTTIEGIDYTFAVVRQGDYLIGVSVTGVTGDDNAAVATEIASKTADNLAALDPAHGRD